MRRGVVLGSVLALVLVTALPAAARELRASLPSGEPVTVEVPATANIFGAGRSSPPAGMGGVGAAPRAYPLPRGTDRLVTFPSVTGKITCCKTGSNAYNGPGGRSDYPTNLTGVPGISGVKSRRAMFLVGVFLRPALGKENLPPKTHTLTPELGQVFYIGNGQGGDGPLEFEVPDDATRLFLGIADGYNFVGKPGYYGDNAGSFTATFEFARDTRRLDVVFDVLARKEVATTKVDDDLVDARLGGAGRMIDARGQRREQGAFSLTLRWRDGDETRLALRPVSRSTKNYYLRRTKLVTGVLQVIRSNDRACRRGRQMPLSLIESEDYAAVHIGGVCSGLTSSLIWKAPSSDIAVSVEEVRVGK